jgi:PIN domain nuclease of toxin-antitoxin system
MHHRRPKLSRAAPDRVQSDALFISPAVILELQFLYEIRRLSLTGPKLVAALAAANDAPLITKDEMIRRHYRRAIW